MTWLWWAGLGFVYLTGAGIVAALVKHDNPKEWANDPSMGIVIFWPVLVPLAIIALPSIGVFDLTSKLLKWRDDSNAKKKKEADEMKKRIAELEEELRASSGGPS